MSTVTINLEYPVTNDGETITVLNLRRPTVGDNILVQKMKELTDAEREVRLFANLADVAPDLIYKLDMKDYSMMAKVFSGFLS